jgi:hypothetical protein
MIYDIQMGTSGYGTTLIYNGPPDLKEGTAVVLPPPGYWSESNQVGVVVQPRPDFDLNNFPHAIRAIVRVMTEAERMQHMADVAVEQDWYEGILAERRTAREAKKKAERIAKGVLGGPVQCKSPMTCTGLPAVAARPYHTHYCRILGHPRGLHDHDGEWAP